MTTSTKFGIQIAGIDIQFSERIEQNVKAIIDLFTPLCFAYVGLSVDLTKTE